eukprot:scaffold5364_cov134-Skeletonema_marinoi.AAC.2
MIFRILGFWPASPITKQRRQKTHKMTLSAYAAIRSQIIIKQTHNIFSALIFHAGSNGAVGGPLSPTPTDVFTATAAAAIFPQSTQQHS